VVTSGGESPSHGAVSIGGAGEAAHQRSSRVPLRILDIWSGP
jgi:hypothetical protein